MIILVLKIIVLLQDHIMQEAGTMIQGVIKKNNEPVIKVLNKQQAQADEVLSKGTFKRPDTNHLKKQELK